MSRQFLTPVGLPSGNTLPAVGSAGNLFFKTDEGKVYVHTGSAWVVQQGPTGPTGATGSTGSTGATGATGPTGAEGTAYGNIDGGRANTIYGGVSPLLGGNAGSF